MRDQNDQVNGISAERRAQMFRGYVKSAMMLAVASSPTRALHSISVQLLHDPSENVIVSIFGVWTTPAPIGSHRSRFSFTQRGIWYGFPPSG